MDTFSRFFRSKIALFLIMGLFSLGLLIATFSAGMAVGYRKAEFSYQWGENYSRNFGGPHGGFIPMMRQGDHEFVEAHGTFGRIIAITGSEITISGNDGIEKVIHTDDATDIRLFHDKIPLAGLHAGDSMVVIGSPNTAGQIHAAFIRVFPATPTLSPTR